MRYPGNVNPDKLNTWINSVLTEYQQDIYRMKGFLSVEGYDEKFVFQGIHMIFQLAPSEPWKKSGKRENILVFIGRKMINIEKKMREGFEKCLMSRTYEEEAKRWKKVID